MRQGHGHHVICLAFVRKVIVYSWFIKNNPLKPMSDAPPMRNNKAKVL